MPKSGGRYQGNFGSYKGGNGKGEFPDDEDAIMAAVDEMLSACGNAGQETMIGDHLADFEDWAIDILEAENSQDDTWGAFAEIVRDAWYEERIDKWQGTREIWVLGYNTIASQFGFHDAYDETGEGIGR